MNAARGRFRWKERLEAAHDVRASLTRRLRQSLWPGAPSAKLLVLAAAAFVAVPILLTSWLHLGWWGAAEDSCRGHELGCGLSIHVMGTALVGALVYYVVFLRKEARAAARMRRSAKRRPETLFSWLSLTGLTGLAMDQHGGADESGAALGIRSASAGTRVVRTPRFAKRIIGRDALVGDIVVDLDDSGGRDPQVIVGDAASGKTMVLVKLAEHLARRGQVPIALSVRDVKVVDFERLARQAYLDRSPDDDAEAAKQWRWLRRRGLITVLADELEKADAKVGPGELVRALREAGRRGLRVVAASRPYALPADFHRGRVDLAPLGPEEVRRDLVERLESHGARSSHADAVRVVDRIMTGADLCQTPYYLALARALAYTGDLPGVEFDRDAQFALLSGYRAALEDSRVRPDAGVTTDMRRRVCIDLEAIAFYRLLGSKSEKDIAKRLAAIRSKVDVADTAGYAQRLGVLETRHNRRIQFAHQTTVAYFASCFLAKDCDDRPFWNEVFAQEQIAPALVLAVFMANAATRSKELAHESCRRLLEHQARRAATGSAPERIDYERVSLVTAAAAIARITPVDDDVADAIIRGAEAELRDPTQARQEHLRLVAAISELGTQAANRALCEYAAKGSEYFVRRQAAKALASGGPAAVDVVVPHIEETMARVADQRAPRAEADDRGGRLEPLTSIAWILPSLRSVTRDAERREPLDRRQQELVRAARESTSQRSLESAVAQGLKLDAMRDQAPRPDPVAVDMVRIGDRRAEFWFSRVLLVQAIALRAKNQSGGAHEHIIAELRRDEHPFVRETAGLCLLGLRTGRLDRYVWGDTTEVATRAPNELAPVASRLVGDIVLSLNLSEYGDPRSRAAFGSENRLPACMSQTRDRSAILGLADPPVTCPFAPYQEAGCLCPYTYDPPPDGIRRELSRAFCRHQRLHARRLPWHHGLSVTRLKRFWAGMEDRARF